MERVCNPNGVNNVWRNVEVLRVKPFHIAGNLYYVGNSNVSSYLLTTNEGLILIDTGFATTVPLLVESIEELGFRMSDIRFVVNTHGHVDHCGGTRRIVGMTGAKTFLHEADVKTVEEGTPLTCAYYIYGIEDFEIFKVDNPMRDGDLITLGDTCIEVIHTPGHTPGGCTFRILIKDGHRSLSTVLWGCPGMWTFESMHRSQGYVGDINDYARSLKRLEELEVDIPISAHPNFYHLLDKAELAQSQGTIEPFIDPLGWNEKLKEFAKRFYEKYMVNQG